MRRIKLYEENGGYIVMAREDGNYYSENTPKNVFTDLDKALKFMKGYMTKSLEKNEKTEKPKRKKKETVSK